MSAACFVSARLCVFRPRNDEIPAITPRFRQLGDHAWQGHANDFLAVAEVLTALPGVCPAMAGTGSAVFSLPLASRLQQDGPSLGWTRRAGSVDRSGPEIAMTHFDDEYTSFHLVHGPIGLR
jgi:hypothetical protein